jgi:drug/metabolite transporter (DMT)-like permease
MMPCGTYCTYSIWNWAIARRGPAYVSVYSYAVPVLAGIISFFLFGDSLSSGQIAGAGIVFAGMRQPSQRSKQPLYAMSFI